MTLNDLESFYVKFLLLRTDLYYIFTVESAYTRDQRRRADVRKRTVIRGIFGTRGKNWIFRICYIVETLTNKTNISI